MQHDNNNIVIPVVTKVVTMFKDSSFDFTTLHTFSMPDTIVHFLPLTGTRVDVTRQFDQTAINQVRQDLHLARLHRDHESATVRPDFVVLVGATATTNYNAFVGYSWFTFWGFYSRLGVVRAGLQHDVGHRLSVVLASSALRRSARHADRRPDSDVERQHHDAHDSLGVDRRGDRRCSTATITATRSPPQSTHVPALAVSHGDPVMP